MCDSQNGDRPRVYVATHKQQEEFARLFETLFDDFVIEDNQDMAEYIVVDLDDPPVEIHRAVQYLPLRPGHKYLSLPDDYLGPVFFFGGQTPPEDPSDRHRWDRLLELIESWCHSQNVQLHSSPDVHNLKEDMRWYDARLRIRRQNGLAMQYRRSSTPPEMVPLPFQIAKIIEMALQMSRNNI